MKRFLIFSGVVLLILIAAAIYWIGTPKGPSFEDVAHLTDPHFVDIPDTKVFQYTATGSPDEVAPRAFAAVMGAYFGLDGAVKFGPEMPSPMARWPVDTNVPSSEWTGLYAMAVPDSTESAPQGVELVTWVYGRMAEILHVGRYDEEPPTVARLMEFIQSSGYVVDGLHEEVYLRGPGMLFEGNPATYLTLIRYPVVKADSANVSAGAAQDSED